MKSLVIVLALVNIVFGVFNDEKDFGTLPTLDVDNEYIVVFREDIPQDRSMKKKN